MRSGPVFAAAAMASALVFQPLHSNAQSPLPPYPLPPSQASPYPVPQYGGGMPISQFEVGGLLWLSASKFRVNLYDTAGATQLSRLSFENMKTGTLELNFKLSGVSTGVFVRGAAGAGMNFGGRLTDEDFSDGFSPGYASTNSPLSDRSMYYFSADVGWTPPIMQSWPVKLSPFLGFFYLRDTFNAQGLACNVASTGALAGYCPAAGASFPGIAPGTDVIKNDITYWAPRAGLAAGWDITRQLALGVDAAYLFLGSYRNEDSHFLRSDIGPVPNFIDTARRGTGTQLQATLDYRFPQSGFKLGVGARWWRLNSNDAVATAGPPGAFADQVSRNTLDIYGGFLRAGYAF